MTIDAHDLPTLFNLLHDGLIHDYQYADQVLLLTIEIRYVTERIDPTFTKLMLTLHPVTRIQFRPWGDSVPASEILLTDIPTIFTPYLEILSAMYDGNAMKIFCSQTDPEYAYSGGELLLELDQATGTMRDEGGTTYSLSALTQHAHTYWKEWAKTAKPGAP